LTGSLIFYAWGDLKYLILLMVSIAVNYFLGLHLGKSVNFQGKARELKKKRFEEKQKKLLWAAIAGNLGVLIFFKSGLSGKEMPLGISFYTFQILSYLIDVYTGREKRESSFVCLAAYIAMFPKLLSGPIAAYGEVRGALHGREFTVERISDGMKTFTLGLVLKVLLADRLGFLWQEVQVTGFESISTPLAWLAAAAYSMKLYFDFYGYSLMAAGLGRMLGFKLPDNFRDPYMATSVREFYRRWHITLGRWFREYIYIPLGGNRGGEFRTVCNLLAVWLLTSLWHGSTANFLLWGMMIWLFIVMERQLDALGFHKLLKWKGLRILPHLYLWVVIPITWMCFAITDVAQLQIYLGRMFGLVEGLRVSAGDWLEAVKTYGYLFLIGAFACTPVFGRVYRKIKDSLPGTFLLAAFFWLCVWRIQREGQNPFMYSNF